MIEISEKNIDEITRILSENELNDFVKNNEKSFRKYIKTLNHFSWNEIFSCNNFVDLLLDEKRAELVGEIHKYSIENLKKLSSLIGEGMTFSKYLVNESFIEKIFENKSNFTHSEFSLLLRLLDRKDEKEFFEEVVNENLDYLFSVFSNGYDIPLCLLTSKQFRDKCIYENRIDLAVKCILPDYILDDKELVKRYCEELKCDEKDFYKRIEFVFLKYKDNNKIFETFLATTLKDNIFNLGDEHIERFSNDVSIQTKLNNLNQKELIILNKILKIYNYNDYDISFMITNAINNIKDYSSLINEIDLNEITTNDIKQFVSIIQFPYNKFNINTLEDLRKYKELKREKFEKNIGKDINTDKDNLLTAIFNIDFDQAVNINNMFFDDNLDLESKEKFLQNICLILKLINRIIGSSDSNELNDIYAKYSRQELYDIEIPLETYLRSIYANMYSKSLYKISDRKDIYGPQDSIHRTYCYNGKNIDLCIPREKFRIMAHTRNYIDDSSYKDAWNGFPIQFHTISCSYIDEKHPWSLYRLQGIVYGFDELENGSLYIMGASDLRGFDNTDYSFIGNNLGNSLFHFYDPDRLSEKASSSHNELLFERRNYNRNKENYFRRQPDYMVLPVNSLDNLELIDDIEELSFLTDLDKEVMRKENYTNITDILSKYNCIFNNGSKKIEKVKSRIIDSINFEETLKAASEFNIPIVVIDKNYYFNKFLSESECYDSEMKEKIQNMYLNDGNVNKISLFNDVMNGSDLSNYFKPKVRKLKLTDIL